MDEILIEDLKVFAYHGLLDFEKEQGQDFYITVQLHLNTQKAGITDNLEHSINYAEICEKIHSFTQNNRFNLIEALAESIADMLLENYEILQSANVTVKKPNAPINKEFKCISVTAHRSWHKVALSIGSNMGDKKSYLQKAVSSLKSNKHFRNIKVSNFIETKPYGNTNQDVFLNAAITCETLFLPEILLEYIHSIEKAAKRVREVHWGPRTLDIDIVFYNDQIIDTDYLTVPHPDMHNRQFVLEPLNEIAPNYTHPVFKKNVNQLLKDLCND